MDDEWLALLNRTSRFIFEKQFFPSLKDDEELARWITRQIIEYESGKMDPQKFELFKSIPGILLYTIPSEESYEPSSDNWTRNFEKLLKFVEKNNFIPLFPDDINDDLIDWCNIQRSKKLKKNLSEKKIEKLESINNWFWIPFDLWKKNFEVLKDFYSQENKKLLKTTSYYDISIGKWAYKQKKLHKKFCLGREKIEMLESISQWTWEIEDIEKEMFDIFKKFYLKYKRLPEKYDMREWYFSHYRDYMNGEMDEDEMERFCDIFIL